MGRDHAAEGGGAEECGGRGGSRGKAQEVAPALGNRMANVGKHGGSLYIMYLSGSV